MTCHNDYLGGVFFNPAEYLALLDRVRATLEPLNVKRIAFRGTSGAAFAFPLSAMCGYNLSHVRKSGGHCDLPLEGWDDNTPYAILDDMVASGNTLRRIIQVVGVQALKALVLYDGYLSDYVRNTLPDGDYTIHTFRDDKTCHRRDPCVY